jgi:uncharacterized protein YbjT (DUF2867 family)
MAKIITVFGATGAQGGSVVDIFSTDPKLKNEWQVRAVTRDVTKDNAKKLAEKGIEVVSVSDARNICLNLRIFTVLTERPQANLDDKASLVEAMTGAEAVFGLTNYWDHLDEQKEIQQGKNLADAAKEANVPLYIFSSLPNVKERTLGAGC